MDSIEEFVDSIISHIDEIKNNRLNPNQKDDSYKNLSSYQRLKTASENVDFNIGRVVDFLFPTRIDPSEYLDEIIIRLHKGNWDSWRRLYLDAPGSVTSGLKRQVEKRSPYKGYALTNLYARGGNDYIQEKYNPVVYTPPITK